jgi:hypothetical protein
MNKDLIISGLSLGFLVFIACCMIFLSNPTKPFTADQIEVPATSETTVP